MPEDASTLEELIVALANEEAALARALESDATDLERHQALLSRWNNRLWAQNVLARTRLDPPHPTTIGALAMVVTHFPDTSEGKEAADLILSKYIDDESLENVFRMLAGSESEPALRILRAAYHSSSAPTVKARAGFWLACLLQTRAERDGWRDLSRSRAETAEAESLLEESESGYGDIRVGEGLLGEVARGQLEELHTLSVGKVAPEIAGEDTDGQPLKLSDYRGKVVALAFWGNWCSLCRSTFPYERSLVMRMKGRPFVLLGVNSDHGTAIARALAEDQTITWRS